MKISQVRVRYILYSHVSFPERPVDTRTLHNLPQPAFLKADKIYYDHFPCI